MRIDVWGGIPGGASALCNLRLGALWRPAVSLAGCPLSPTAFGWPRPRTAALHRLSPGPAKCSCRPQVSAVRPSNPRLGWRPPPQLLAALLPGTRIRCLTDTAPAKKPLFFSHRSPFQPNMGCPLGVQHPVCTHRCPPVPLFASPPIKKCTQCATAWVAFMRKPELRQLVATLLRQRAWAQTKTRESLGVSACLGYVEAHLQAQSRLLAMKKINSLCQVWCGSVT